MRRYLAISLIGVCLGLTAVHASDTVDGALAELRGEWKLCSLEIEGNPGPGDEVENASLRFQGQEVRFLDPAHPGAARLTLDPSKQPAEMDLEITEGKGNGDHCPGIYRLEKDQLTLCFRLRRQDKGRPSEFKTEAESGLALMKLERVKQ